MTYTLLIDTNTSFSALGLAKDAVLIKEKNNLPATEQAETLLVTIEALLASQGIDYASLSSIVINRGPGSFTGLRIGLAAAVGLGLAQHIPVVTLTGFDVLAAKISCEKRKKGILAIMDAKRGACYAQYLDYEGNALGEAVLMEDVEVYKACLDFDVIGCVSEDMKMRWQLFPEGVSFLQHVVLPSLQGMLALYRGGKASHVLMPLYVRPPDAKPQKMFWT